MPYDLTDRPGRLLPLLRDLIEQNALLAGELGFYRAATHIREAAAMIDDDARATAFGLVDRHREP